MPEDYDHRSLPTAGGAEPADRGTDRTDERRHRLQLLRWRSRRGLLELELLLLPFADECLIDLEEPELDAYERLLACDDLDIYEWLQGRARPPDPELDAIVARIAAHLDSAAGR